MSLNIFQNLENEDDEDQEGDISGTLKEDQNEKDIEQAMTIHSIKFINQNEQGEYGAFYQDGLKVNNKQIRIPVGKRERLMMISQISQVDIENEQHQQVVIEILKSKKRSPKELAFLQNLLSYLPFFERNQELMQKSSFNQKLLEELNYQFFKKNEIIFNYGDYGYVYYIVVRGAVNLYMPKLSKDDKRGKNQFSNLKAQASERTLKISKNKKTKLENGTDKPVSFAYLPMNSNNNTPNSLDNINQSPRFSDERIDLPYLKSESSYKSLNRPSKLALFEKYQTLTFLPNDNDLNYENQTNSLNEDKESSILNKIFSDMNMVKTFLPGQGFGEISLMTKQRRTGTMVCTEDTHLITLSKHAFDNMLGRYHEQIKTERLGFLQTFQFLQNIPNSNLLSILLDIKIQVLTYKQLVFSQEQKVSNIIFIKRGQVQLSKKYFDLKKIEESPQKSRNNNPINHQANIEELNTSLKQNKIKKSTKIAILAIQAENSHLGLEDMFDRDFQLKKEADYSMKAEVVSESAELYVLDKNIFLNNIRIFGGMEAFIEEIKKKLEYYSFRELEVKETTKQSSISMNLLLKYIEERKELSLKKESSNNQNHINEQKEDISDLPAHLPKKNTKNHKLKILQSSQEYQLRSGIIHPCLSSSVSYYGKDQHSINMLDNIQYMSQHIQESSIQLNDSYQNARQNKNSLSNINNNQRSIQFPRLYEKSQYQNDSIEKEQNSCHKNHQESQFRLRKCNAQHSQESLQQFHSQNQELSSEKVSQHQDNALSATKREGIISNDYFRQRKDMYDQFKGEGRNLMKKDRLRRKKQDDDLHLIEIDQYKVRYNSLKHSNLASSRNSRNQQQYQQQQENNNRITLDQISQELIMHLQIQQNKQSRYQESESQERLNSKNASPDNINSHTKNKGVQSCSLTDKNELSSSIHLTNKQSKCPPLKLPVNIQQMSYHLSQVTSSSSRYPSQNKLRQITSQQSQQSLSNKVYNMHVEHAKKINFLMPQKPDSYQIQLLALQDKQDAQLLSNKGLFLSPRK